MLTLRIYIDILIAAYLFVFTPNAHAVSPSLFIGYMISSFFLMVILNFDLLHYIYRDHLFT